MGITREQFKYIGECLYEDLREYAYKSVRDSMKDEQNTYPDLVNVEDWLNAKGYTGEAGACHAAMSLIRKQENRIAVLEAEVFAGNDWLNARAAVLQELAEANARIAALKAALKPFADVPSHGEFGGPMVQARVYYECEPNDRCGVVRISNYDFRAARAAMEEK